MYSLRISLNICFLWLIASMLPLGVSAQDYDDLEQHILDSVTDIANNSSDIKARLEALDFITINHPNVDSTLKYCEIEAKLAKEQGDYFKLVSSLRVAAWCHYYNFNYNLANEYYFKALHVSDSVQYKFGIGMCYHSIANTMAMMSNFAEADKYDYLALQIFYELNDTANISEIHRSLGLMYADFQLYSTAEEHFSKALELDIIQNNTKKIADDYRHFAVINLCRYDDLLQDSLILKARNYGLKNYRLIKNTGTDFDIMISCLNLMRIYYEYAEDNTARQQQLMDSSRFFYRKGRSIAARDGFLEKSCDFKMQEARYAILDQNFDDALRLIKETEGIMRDDSSALLFMDLYSAYSHYYTAIGNYKKAYDYLCRRTELKDKFLNSNSSLYSSKSNVQNEFDEMMTKISLEDQKKHIRQMEEERLWQIINGSAIGLIILTIIIIITIRRGRRHKRVLSRILEQRMEEVETQRNQLETMNSQMKQSINFAQHIQDSILPQNQALEEMFGDMLILWKPLDIVSGDFYWGTATGGNKLLAVVDCTGHGVPGAFMSMLGVRSLGDIVASAKTEGRELNAADILNRMRDNVITSLHQTEQNSLTLDGMDMALIILNDSTMEMQYAGAFRPLVIIRGDEVKIIKADKMPISFIKADDRPFNNNVIEMQKGDTVYMFSDGIPDQFGLRKDGSESKFSTKRLITLLQEIHDKPFAEQKKLIEEELDKWRQNGQSSYPQTDDIVLCGFKI